MAHHHSDALNVAPTAAGYDPTIQDAQHALPFHPPHPSSRYSSSPDAMIVSSAPSAPLSTFPIPASDASAVPVSMPGHVVVDAANPNARLPAHFSHPLTPQQIHMPIPAQSPPRSYTPTLQNSRQSPLHNRRRKPPPSAPLSFRTIRPAAVHSMQVPPNSQSLPSGAADAAAAAAAVAASVVNRDICHQSHASTAAAAAAAAAAAVMNHVSSTDMDHGGVSSSQAKQAVAIVAAAAARATVAHSMGIPSLAVIPENDVQEQPQSENGTKKKPRKRKPRTGPANFICDVEGCGKAFRMQGDLQTHMRKHTGDEPFVCSYPNCGRRYKWRSSLSHHEGLHRKSKDLRVRRRVRKPNSNNASSSVAMSTPTQSPVNPTGSTNVSPSAAPAVPMQQLVQAKPPNQFQTHTPMASVAQNTAIAVQHLNGVDNILGRGATAIMPRPPSSFMTNPAYASPSHSMHEQISLSLGNGGVSMPILQQQPSQGHVTPNHLLDNHHVHGSFSHQNQPWNSHVSLDALHQGQYLKKDHILHNHLVLHNTDNHSVPQSMSIDKSQCGLNTHEGLSEVQLPVVTNSIPTSNASVLGDPNLSSHVSDGSRLAINASDFHSTMENQEFQNTNDQGGLLNLVPKSSSMITSEAPMLSQRHSDHRNEPEDMRYAHPVEDLQSNQLSTGSAPHEIQHQERLAQQSKELSPESLSKSGLQSEAQQKHKDLAQTNSSSSVPADQSGEHPADDSQPKEQFANQSNEEDVATNTLKESEGLGELSKQTESKFKGTDNAAQSGTDEKSNGEVADGAPASANSSTDPTSERAS